MSASTTAREHPEPGWRWWLLLEVAVWVAVGVFALADEALLLATLADLWGARLAIGAP